MTTSIAFRSRLPGVTCDPRLVPEPPGVRLDVAAFVGFANRGPLNVPMPVDDARVFDQLYGPDVELAVDDRDRPVFGHLGSSVRSFFANGGRRCYVVRVAGPSASAARFRLAGIEIASIGAPGSMVDPAPLDLDAATAGVWADAMGVTGEVVAHHMLSETVMDGTIRCRALTATARSEVAVGDLLAVIPPGGTTVRLITVGGVDGTSLSGVRPVAEVNASLVGSRVTSPQVATPSDRWPDGATVLRLRLRLDVDEADRFVVSRVEQIDGLMLGALDGGGAPPVSGNSDSAGAQPWVARIQQHDTVDFDASRSRRLRSPSIAGSVMLMPTDVRLSAAMPITSSLTAADMMASTGSTPRPCSSTQSCPTPPLCRSASESRCSGRDSTGARPALFTPSTPSLRWPLSHCLTSATRRGVRGRHHRNDRSSNRRSPSRLASWTAAQRVRAATCPARSSDPWSSPRTVSPNHSEERTLDRSALFTQRCWCSAGAGPTS